MTKEKCRKCGGDKFYIISQSVNGGYTADRQCVKCGDTVELIDTYTDQNND